MDGYRGGDDRIPGERASEGLDCYSNVIGFAIEGSCQLRTRAACRGSSVRDTRVRDLGCDGRVGHRQLAFDHTTSSQIGIASGPRRSCVLRSADPSLDSALHPHVSSASVLRRWDSLAWLRGADTRSDPSTSLQSSRVVVGVDPSRDDCGPCLGLAGYRRRCDAPIIEGSPDDRRL